MRNIFDRPIPVGWFAVVLSLGVVGYGVTLYKQAEHDKIMSAFMAGTTGNRFTRSDGDALIAEIEQLKQAEARNAEAVQLNRKLLEENRQMLEKLSKQEANSGH